MIEGNHVGDTLLVLELKCQRKMQRKKGLPEHL